MFVSSFRKLGAYVCVALGPAILIAQPGGARAGDHTSFDDNIDVSMVAATDIRPHWREVWAGAIFTDFGWSAYSGLTVSPFGGIQDDGFRVRVVGGYGRYRYSGSRWTGSTNETVEYRGTGAFTDVLAGYHMAWGPLTLKAFAGVTTDAQLIEPLDTGNAAQGRATGAKVALETWLNLSDRAWLSVDASWSSSHSAHGANARLGFRLASDISAGLEAASFGNKEGEGGRAGVFARYEWESGEISAAGGMTGRIWEQKGPGGSAYGTLNWVARY